MQVSVNKTVSYAVANINIGMLQVTKDSTEALVFMIIAQWTDSTGAILRNVSQRYTQAQLLAATTNPTQTTAAFTAIKNLFLTGSNPILRLTINNSNIATVQAFSKTTTVQTKTYTEAELVTAGLSSAIISGIVTELANALT